VAKSLDVVVEATDSTFKYPEIGPSKGIHNRSNRRNVSGKNVKTFRIC
jgi:hypothetical protein